MYNCTYIDIGGYIWKMDKHKDLIIVIGAGQTGLAMGYYLRKLNKPFLVVDAYRRVGDAWRKRYDSLTLFTPRKYSELPGMGMTGDPDGYPHKDEVADYLEAYAEKFQLPIQLSTQIVQAALRDGGFSLKTSQGDIFARTLIVATGPFSRPFIPQLSGRLSGEVVQLHTADISKSWAATKRKCHGNRGGKLWGANRDRASRNKSYCLFICWKAYPHVASPDWREESILVDGCLGNLQSDC